MKAQNMEGTDTGSPFKFAGAGPAMSAREGGGGFTHARESKSFWAEATSSKRISDFEYHSIVC